MTSINLERLCCLKTRLESLASFDSVSQIVNWTSICFGNLEWGSRRKFRYILHNFYNESSPFNQSACTTTGMARNDETMSDACDIPTTSLNNLYIAVWSVMLIMTIFSNIIVLLAMRKTAFKSHNTSLLLGSLAVSDLLVGLFIIPIKIKFTYHNQRFCSSSILCNLYITADNAFFTVSITNLFIICLDKYLALNYPFKYPAWMSRKRTKIFIAAAWFNGVLWGTLSHVKFDDIKKPAVKISGFQCTIDNYIYTLAVAIAVFFVPALIMGRLYFKILTIARYHARGISEAVFFDNNNVKHKNEKSKDIATDGDRNCVVTKLDERKGSTFSNYAIDGQHRPSKLIQIFYYRRMVFKASKTVAVVYGAFVICWLPVMCWAVIIIFCDKCKNVVWFYYVFVEVVPVFNSMMNPFIYALTNKQFRNAFKEVLMIKRSKQ